ADVLEGFPHLQVILAHLGRGHFDEAVELAGRFPQVAFDTCAVITAAEVPWRLPDAEAGALRRRPRVERGCFGSDSPRFAPGGHAARVAALPGRGDGERAAILGENARRVLDAGS